MTTSAREVRDTDTLTRNPVTPMRIEHLRVLGQLGEMRDQYHAHLFELVKFHRNNGTTLDASGKPILRAGAQRKVDRRVAAIEEIRGLIPVAPASIAIAEARLRLFS